MRSSDFQLIATRLPIILTALIALAGTVLIGAAIGQGEFIQIYLLFFGLAALFTVLVIGSKYWLLIPIAFSVNLPAIPFHGRAFELPELAIILCTILFACRYAISPGGVTLFRRAHAGVLLYTAWAGMIFVLHPVGMMVMGSSTGGARFYFKIALAFAAFLIVANQKITERDAKWIIRLLIIGSVISMAVDIAQYKLFGPSMAYTDPNAVAQEYYTWHQELASPAMWIMLWLVSRYKIREIFSLAKPWTLFLFILCIVLAAISGKRAGFASVLLTPLIAAMIRKEYFYVLCGAALGTLLIFSLTLGQGSLFRLPLQVQRSLSYLPGNWDWEVRADTKSGIDPFRKEMRELAWKNINEHPFVGQGYALNANEIYAIAAEGDLHMFILLSLGLGSSWHNTWLGIWADFGFPAVLFWAIFWVQAVAIGLSVYRRTLHGSLYRTLALMLLLSFILDISRSWTSGHSATDPFTRWWMFGVLISLKSTVRPEKLSPPEESTPSLRQPEIVRS